VGEGGGRPRLAQEPGPGLFIGLDIVAQRLQRDTAVQPHVLREIHLAHTAASEPLEDAVVADRFADHETSIMTLAGGRRGPLGGAGGATPA
jgi:hypothetical protein